MVLSFFNTLPGPINDIINFDIKVTRSMGEGNCVVLTQVTMGYSKILISNPGLFSASVILLLY